MIVFSTQKRNRQQNVRIAKPDNTDKQNIQSLLLVGKHLYIPQAEIMYKG